MISDSITTQFANLSSLQILDLLCSYLTNDFSSLSISLSSLKSSFNSRVSYINNGNVSCANLGWLQGLVNLRELSLDGVDLSTASQLTNWAEPISFLYNLRQLHLSDCGISGSIPVNHFLNLTHLSSLGMGFNFLTSTFSAQLGNLTSLSSLELENSHLQGHMAYLPQLQQLYIDDNPDLAVDLTSLFARPWPYLLTLSIRNTNISGLIPPSISNATTLLNLFASGSFIQGPIPTSLFNLSDLQYLDLGENNLVGSLPSSISGLKSLEFLVLFQNEFNGQIPESICDISSLQTIHLANNVFNGRIPDCIGRLPNIEKFYVSSNSMEATPFSLISLFQNSTPYEIDLGSSGITVRTDSYPFPSNFQPQILGLHSCNLGGEIPDFLSNLTQLVALDLANNSLTGTIPSWLFKLPKHGEIPSQIGQQLSNARYMTLSGNKLSGGIPNSLCQPNNVHLQVLDLSNNELTGTIPSTLRNCRSLISLNLGKNRLTGNLPTELGYIKSLSSLQLNDNRVGGPLPNSIEHLQNMEFLILESNMLEGNIPSFIGKLRNLRILVLKSNSFNGSIPNEITQLRKLQIIDLSYNKLSGLIPDEMGNFEMLVRRPKERVRLGYMISLTYAGIELDMATKGTVQEFQFVFSYSSGIDLSSNFIEGKIPAQMGWLQGLYMLNLSKNAVSGAIPVNFGNMSGLESLDLSFNYLDGEIPMALASLDYLGFLDLSYNNLSGKIPSGLRFDTLTWEGSAYIGNPLLCGPPVRRSCVGTTDQTNEGAEEHGKETWLFFGFMAIGYGFGLLGPFLVLVVAKRKWWDGYWRFIDDVALIVIKWASKV
ncbi:receptor-like protein EIX1 [Magnolia sinica]|uniref:receptor-like protein EIX1 n=1 Tax=Magnolia sinica TaxID=86752 RepID=UPI002659C290|nr:receptor-like protein EIX1 [Magnolia sinica]